MSDYPYLIAIALIEQDGKRLMPLGGKSLKNSLGPEEDPGPFGESIALELLVRVMQRSDDNSLKRAEEENSLLLLEMPIDSMQENLPSIKSKWIEAGDFNKLLFELKRFCSGIWRLKFVRYEGIYFNRLH